MLRMFHALQHLQLVVHHLLIALDVLLEDDLDCHLAIGAVGLAHNAVRAGAERLAKAVARSATAVLSVTVAQASHQGHMSRGWRGLLVVAAGLSVQLVEHVGDCVRQRHRCVVQDARLPDTHGSYWRLDPSKLEEEQEQGDQAASGAAEKTAREVRWRGTPR